MASSKKPAKPIVDVAHPGKSAPSGTSKPVIVTNRPILKDPMVVEDEAKNDGSITVNVKTTAPTLKPTSTKSKENSKPDGSNVKVLTKTESKQEPDNKLDEKVEEKPEEKAAPEPETATEPAAQPAAEKSTDDVPTTKADAEAAAAAEADATAAKEAEADEAIQALVDSKQYYLPINTVEKRKTKRFVALGVLLALVLAVAWADVALDAGLIHLSGIKPVTHFFSN